MLDTLRYLFAPKIGLRAILRGSISQEAAMTLQVIVRSTGISGWMRVVVGSHVLIELEGPRPKIEALIDQLQHTTLSHHPTTLELTWRPSKNEFTSFHAAF